MKLRFALLLVLPLLIASYAAADVVYTNGPINGNISAYSFATQYGWEMANSFTVGSDSTITGFAIGSWVYPGDTPTTFSWQILTGGPSWLGGTVVASGDATWTSNTFWGLGFGYYYVYTSELDGLNVNLSSGEYWLQLSNGVTNVPGDPIYWDENDGPSTAHQGYYGSEYGQVGSEAFTIFGSQGTSGGGTVPEPSSLVLFGSGILGLAGLLRRRIGL